MNKIVIVTKKFGRNFTGATLATQCLVEKWCERKIQIKVFTNIEGEHKKWPGLSVQVCDNKWELKRKIHMFFVSNNECVFYSDDHLGYILADLKIPYFHTYHGNWPDAKYVSMDMFLKSFYFMPLYKKTISFARTVINVSYYMERFTLKYNPKSEIIHNGIDYKDKQENEGYQDTFIMVGNIDRRKYKYTTKLAQNLQKKDPDIKIHIYGRMIDQKIGKRLRSQKNIVLKGEKRDIPYKSYKGLICASVMENLSISVCEAILSQIPVLCFDVGGLKEIVIEGKTGRVIPKYDVGLLAEAVFQCAKQEKIYIETEDFWEFEWGYAAEKYLKLFFQ